MVKMNTSDMVSPSAGVDFVQIDTHLSYLVSDDWNASDNNEYDKNRSVIKIIALEPSTPCVSQDVTFNFYVNFVIIGTLCVCGLVGNTLSILVLHRDPHNKVAVFLLKALAVADNLLLSVSLITLSVFMGLIPYLSDKGEVMPMDDVNIYLPIIMDPLGAMAQTVVVWFTVLLAFNRFIAVCIPFKAMQLCTARIVKIQVFVVVIFAVSFNVPRFFQNRIKWTYHNGTAPDKELEGSEIGTRTTFGIVYTNALYSILVLLLPLVFLIGLNCRLIRDLRASRRRASNVPGRYGIQIPTEESISFIMIIIVVVFIVCQIPDRICQVIRLVLFKDVQCDTVQSKVQALCNLLIIINSSSNFIIYYVFRRSFRKILKQRICALPGFKLSTPALNRNQRISREMPHAYASECNIAKVAGTCGVANNPLLTTTR